MWMYVTFMITQASVSSVCFICDRLAQFVNIKTTECQLQPNQ